MRLNKLGGTGGQEFPKKKQILPCSSFSLSFFTFPSGFFWVCFVGVEKGKMFGIIGAPSKVTFWAEQVKKGKIIGKRRTLALYFWFCGGGALFGWAFFFIFFVGNSYRGHS